MSDKLPASFFTKLNETPRDPWYPASVVIDIPPPDPIVTAVRAEIRIRSWHMFVAAGAGVLLANAAIWLLHRVGVL